MSAPGPLLRLSLPELPSRRSTPEPPVSESWSAPPKRCAEGRVPLASLREMLSEPPRPNTVTRNVFATVGVPTGTFTAPPLTRILPAASRLMTIWLPRPSPSTVSAPVGENDAVTAALAEAGSMATASKAAAAAVSAARRREIVMPGRSRRRVAAG
jgi:hypothetical protein